MIRVVREGESSNYAPISQQGDHDTSKMDNRHSPSPVPDLNRNRLPTLFEVLSRRTLPPVDLFSFYIFMRDQQRSVDYLDFWCEILRRTKMALVPLRVSSLTTGITGSMSPST